MGLGTDKSLSNFVCSCSDVKSQRRCQHLTNAGCKESQFHSLPFVQAVASMSSSSSSSVGCRAGDYELPPATTILCQFRQLARANHVVCVSQKVLNVSEKQGSLPSWFSLPMWWNIQCVLLAWLIIRHPEYMAQKPQSAHKSFQLAPKPFLISRIDYNPSVIWISPKNSTCPSGKLRTKITSPIAKSTSPGLSDTTFFARWNAFGGMVMLGIDWAIMMTMQPSLKTMKTVTACEQAFHLRDIKRSLEFGKNSSYLHTKQHSTMAPHLLCQPFQPALNK